MTGFILAGVGHKSSEGSNFLVVRPGRIALILIIMIAIIIIIIIVIKMT